MDGMARSCGVDIPAAEEEPHNHAGILQNVGGSVKPCGVVCAKCEYSGNREMGGTYEIRATCGTADFTGSSSLAVSLFSPLARFPLLSRRRHDRESHRAHQTHLVDLFSHVNFHLISAGLPSTLWRGEREVAAFIFERNMHGILSDHHGGIEAVYRFREAVAEYLEPLIMLVEVEDDENRRGIGTELVSRFHRHNLVRTLKAEFLVESFRRRNGEEQALRRGVEVVGNDVLLAVLKVRDRSILGDRQLRCPECRQRREADDNDRRDRPSPRSSRASRHIFLVHRPAGAVKVTNLR